MLDVANQPRRTSGLSPKQRKKLTQCFEKLNVLAFEPLLSPGNGMELPNTLTIPYSTTFHYLPRAPARDIAFVPDKAGDEQGTQIGWPPSRSGADWAPEKFMDHERPILASYVGVGRSRSHAAGVLWQTKEQVSAITMR